MPAHAKFALPLTWQERVAMSRKSERLLWLGLVPLGLITVVGVLRCGAAAEVPPLATLAGYAGPVHAVAFSPDGKTLAVGVGQLGHPGEIQLWDVGSGVCRAFLPGRAQAVQCVAFAPDGRTLASAEF